MRNFLLPLVYMISLSGCAVTEAITEEALLFSDFKEQQADSKMILEPFEDISLSLEFWCSGIIHSVMLSPLIPLPPIVPAGYMNMKESDLRVDLPVDADTLIDNIDIKNQQGDVIKLFDENDHHIIQNGKILHSIYLMRHDCKELEGGTVEIHGFIYKNVLYPTLKYYLQYKTKFKIHAGYLGA